MPAEGTSFCEWKGRAVYHTLLGGNGARAERAGWSYPDPTPGFAPIAGYVAFYVAPMDACLVDGARAAAGRRVLRGPDHG